jgi:hypothetical protein
MAIYTLARQGLLALRDEPRRWTLARPVRPRVRHRGTAGGHSNIGREIGQGTNLFHAFG